MDHMRQTDIYNPNEQAAITIIGSGSVGSYVAYALAKMGLKNITVYDNDKVEPHNVPIQFFKMGNIGENKVEALNKNIEDFCGLKIKPIPKNATKTDIEKCMSNIVIFAVDSMKARKTLFEGFTLNPHATTLIDIRTAGEQYRIFTINLGSMEEIEYYSKSLFNDGEGSRLACTAQGIIYSILNMSSEVANNVKKLIKGDPTPIMMIVDMKTRHRVIKDD